MAPTRYTLDMLRDDVDRKYGPFVVELGGNATATLHPVLRLPQERRARFTELQGRLNDQQGDDSGTDLDAVADTIRELLRTVAATPGDADRLLAAIPDDTAYVLELFQQYAERTQPGEASASPN